MAQPYLRPGTPTFTPPPPYLKCCKRDGISEMKCIFLLYLDFHKDVNYLYAIPLKLFYTDSIKLASKPAISRYQVPHSKGATLFCSSPLGDPFLRLAVAVKSKVYMLAYKHPANMVLDGSPPMPVSSTDPKENFIKHRVRKVSGTWAAVIYLRA